jgi:hypothetical protein
MSLCLLEPMGYISNIKSEPNANNELRITDTLKSMEVVCEVGQGQWNPL